MTIALGYSRVSTREQATGGVSLEMQAQHMAQCCTAREWEIEVYSDPGFSGAKWNRPGLQRLLHRLRLGEPRPAALVVYRLDRLSRKMRDVVVLLEELEECGIAFVSTSEPQYDRTTPLGRAMIHVGASFAQFQRDLTAEVTTDAVYEHASSGKWRGRPPLGYRCVEGVLQPDANADLVRLAFRLYAEEHAGTFTIARRLNLSTPQRRWIGDDVRRMLTRPVYRGAVMINGQEFPGLHESLVSDELWQAAQRVHSSRRLVGRAGERGQYLLSGLLKCRDRDCGANMIGRKGGTLGAPAYICGRSIRVYPSRGTSIRIAKAHHLLCEAFRELARRGADLGRIATVRRSPQPDTELSRLEEQLARLPGRKSNLVRFASHGTISEDDLQAQLTGLEAEASQLQVALATLQRPPALDIPTTRRLFRDFAAIIEDEATPLRVKKDLLADHLKAIVIHPEGRVELTLLQDD